MKSVILRLILILSLISNIATSGLQAQGPDAGAKALFVKTKDRKSTRLNSSHSQISYAVFCLKKKNKSLARSGRLNESSVVFTSSDAFLLRPRCMQFFSPCAVCTFSHDACRLQLSLPVDAPAI